MAMKESTKKESTKKPNWCYLVCFLVVSFFAYHSVWTTTKAAYDASPDTDIYYHQLHQSTGVGTDAELILSGIDSRDNFRDTLSFWSGPWAAGPTHGYYRPLPSTIWWLMRNNLGPNSLATFLVVLAVSHVVAVFLLWGFLADLFESILTSSVIICFWLIGLAESLFRFTGPHGALYSWVDHIEMWSTLSVIGACWTFLRYIRDDNRRWLYATGGIFLIGVTIKEMIYIVPILCFVLLWHENKLVQWKRVIPIGLLAFICLLYRFWAVQGTNQQITSNGSWYNRALSETLLGTVGGIITRGDTFPLAVAATILSAACFLTRRTWRWRLAWLGLAAALLVPAVHFSKGMEDPFYYRLIGGKEVWIHAGNALLWVLLAWTFCAKKNRHQWFGWLWVAVSYLPLLNSPNTSHIFYIPSIGWAIALTFAIWELYGTAGSLLNKRNLNSRKPVVNTCLSS